MKLYGVIIFIMVFIMVFIMLFIVKGRVTEHFTMENIGPFNPDGYGDRGVYFDRSGLKPRMFRKFPY